MKRFLSILCAVAVLFALCGCKADQPAKKISVYMINGPTGMGAVNLMDKAEKGETEEKYAFTVVTDPNEIVSKISSGDADIAAVSTNIAAKVYAKTGGGIKVLAVNTLGVLNVVTLATPVTSFADLAGKKIYSTGKGGNPEIIINYLLEKNNINPADININYMADGSELLTVFAKETDAVIIAPQPVATSITAKYEGAKIALSLTEEWQKVSNDSALMMGCIIARTDFIKNNEAAVKKFLKDYEESVTAANNNADSTAALCEKYGIVPKAAIAKKALPECNICFVTGEKMKADLSGYLAVLYGFDKTATGGKLPGDNFYYEYEN